MFLFVVVVGVCLFVFLFFAFCSIFCCFFFGFLLFCLCVCVVFFLFFFLLWFWFDLVWFGVFLFFVFSSGVCFLLFSFFSFHFVVVVVVVVVVVSLLFRFVLFCVVRVWSGLVCYVLSYFLRCFFCLFVLFIANRLPLTLHRVNHKKFPVSRQLLMVSKATTLVMDEADMLMEGSYKKQLDDILVAFRRADRTQVEEEGEGGVTLRDIAKTQYGKFFQNALFCVPLCRLPSSRARPPPCAPGRRKKKICPPPPTQPLPHFPRLP